MSTRDHAVPRVTRRVVLTRALFLPFAGALPAVVGACSRAPRCDDTSGLSADDVKVRTEAAAYVERSPEFAKRCDACAQFVSAGEKSCGTCKVVKGPINPLGTCKLFVPKS